MARYISVKFKRLINTVHFNIHARRYIGKLLFRKTVAVITPVVARLFRFCDRNRFNARIDKRICAGINMVVRAEGIGKPEKPERNAGKQNCYHKPYFLVFKSACAYFKGVGHGQL